MERWSGRTAVVTGASGGIGSALTRALANAGLRVMGLDKQLPADDECTGTGTGSIVSRLCDITDLAAVDSAFSWVEEHMGGTHVLVNCAGVSSLGHITDVGSNTLSDADISKTFDINIKAMVFCTRRAVASMTGRGFDGHIVNINSVAGHYIPFTDTFNVYSSSKYAVTAFNASLANELATFKSGIKTTSISPGLVRTGLSAAFSAGLPALRPADVADALLYVLSTPARVNITELTIQPVAEKLL